ncbi:A nuclease family of the HNH/ENDO VII superfamily with conserved AHH [Alteromonadaceae bacterium Bs31]|nr:A nuclease family of the HNH/ENDO VII superfamily with conserved AHH [Alteromonadaceae bacterium Bs31]
MTELLEKIQIHLDSPDSEDCPFCPGKETKHEWKTFKGEDNNSGTLRDAMNKPSRCGHAQQTGAKPKDGKYPNQNKDNPRPSPNPIYSNSQYGAYSNQAHHCISGNEIMKGHPLEDIITNKSGDYKGQTGYTINNAANGVFLPSYPANYSGSEDDKYKIMKIPMAANKGQAHIGGHSGHEHAVGNDYPTAIKKELTAIKRRVLQKSEECPFCVENDGTAKKPFVPPYGVNQWLDNLSKRIDGKLTGPVKTWPYFISKYAKKYHKEQTAPKSPLKNRFK